MRETDFTHDFRGKPYSVQFTRRLPKGTQGDTHEQKRRIRLLKGIKCPQRQLEVAIDEALHACCWDLDNDVVDEIAKDVQLYLTRLGFGLLPE